MQIGCHLSIRKGYLEAAKAASAIGASAFQYFPKNPRSLKVKAFNRQDASFCADYCRTHGIVTIAHTPYPTNLAADEGPLRDAVVASLRNDLDVAEACGSLGAVVHFGKYKGADPLQGYKNIIQCINEVLTGYEGGALLLIENQAGDGTRMGTTPEELVQVRNLCADKAKIGFCFDTCHAFASGLWLPTDDGWETLEEKLRGTGYLPHLKALHLNDSMYPAGEGKDRHAMIGKGHIGESRFRSMLRSGALRSLAPLPAVLETPAPPGKGHADEIGYVKELSEA